MLDPASMSPGSVMPKYPWLFRRDLDLSSTNSKISAMRSLGVPYEAGYEAKANADLAEQADKIAASLKTDKIEISSKKEIIALIAYLQRVGKDIKSEPKEAVK